MGWNALGLLARGLLVLGLLALGLLARGLPTSAAAVPALGPAARLLIAGIRCFCEGFYVQLAGSPRLPGRVTPLAAFCCSSAWRDSR